ncbi:MAG: 2-amino-4-hydroxy-6-hydroxymethyldihydropteridine diphosphokinase [Candidatus Eremiobacteraeota bacterium]|nr:2-amino-4-hydroxy-6-hydroxymethyldihydropteridine diphosphokinase [Candidatus Eremiobacteraeota bacterium]
MSVHRAYVGVGANLGDARATVERALDALDNVGTLIRRSSLYRTRPWGKTDQPAFVNAVALVETTLEPRPLLGALRDIERRLGRVRAERWGARTIDLDLLTYDRASLDEPGLTIPHPYLRERAFVLVPLAEIDAGYAPLRDALPPSERDGVEPLGDRS